MRTTEPTREAEIPVTEEVEATIRERLATFDEDSKKAVPWPEAMRRILSRHPAP